MENATRKVSTILKLLTSLQVQGLVLHYHHASQKKGLGWERNESGCVFIITMPTPQQSSPKAQCIVNLYIALHFPCFINPKQNTILD